MNTTRLRELCDAVENGSARMEDLAELVTLAREAASAAEDRETAVHLLGQSDVKRFWLLKRNGQLETIASRYEIIRLHEERTPTFVVPCVCGHDGMAHWMCRWKCGVDGCQCKRHEKVTSLEVPGETDGAWETSAGS